MDIHQQLPTIILGTLTINCGLMRQFPFIINYKLKLLYHSPCTCVILSTNERGQINFSVI